jgi:hypothetical protein
MRRYVQSAWRGLALAFAVSSLDACHDYRAEVGTVQLDDSAGIMSESTKTWVRAFRYPTGFFYAVKTVDSIPMATAGRLADQAFEAISKRPSAGKAFKKRGVLLFVSRRPLLVQLRAGSEIYSLARWGGVTAGTNYVNHQSTASSLNVDDAVRKIVSWTAIDLPDVTRTSWLDRIILQDLVQELHEELDDLGTLSEGFYGHFVVRPIAALRIRELRRFDTWWMTYLLVGLVGALLKKLVDKFLTAPLKQRSIALGNSVGLLLHVVIGVSLTLPAVATAILLAGSRTEDQWAIRTSGLLGVERLTFDPQAFNARTVLWLALLLFAVRLLKGIAARGWLAGLASLPASMQILLFHREKEANPLRAFILVAIGTRPDSSMPISEDEYERRPYSYSYCRPMFDDVGISIRWALLAWLFLPKPFTLALLYTWPISIASGTYSTIRSLRYWGKWSKEEQ